MHIQSIQRPCRWLRHWFEQLLSEALSWFCVVFFIYFFLIYFNSWHSKLNVVFLPVLWLDINFVLLYRLYYFSFFFFLIIFYFCLKIYSNSSLYSSFISSLWCLLATFSNMLGKYGLSLKAHICLESIYTSGLIFWEEFYSSTTGSLKWFPFKFHYSWCWSLLTPWKLLSGVEKAKEKMKLALLAKGAI